MQDYLTYTSDSIVEEHTEKLLKNGTVEKRIHAKKYIRNVLVEFFLQDYRFECFLENNPNKAIYRGQLYWDAETGIGKYLLPSLSFDTVKYESKFCLPPFFEEMNLQFSGEEKRNLAEHIYRQLMFRLTKFDDNQGYHDLEEYLRRLNQRIRISDNKEKLEKTEELLLESSQLKEELTKVSGELGNETKRAFAILTRKLIQLGRDYERYDLNNKGAFDRLHKQARSSGKSTKPFKSLRRYEKLILQYFAENRNLTAEELINLVIKRGLLSCPNGFPVPHGKCMIVDQETGSEKSYSSMKKAVRKTLIENYKAGNYPEADAKNSYSTGDFS